MNQGAPLFELFFPSNETASSVFLGGAKTSQGAWSGAPSSPPPGYCCCLGLGCLVQFLNIITVDFCFLVCVFFGGRGAGKPTSGCGAVLSKLTKTLLLVNIFMKFSLLHIVFQCNFPARAAYQVVALPKASVSSFSFLLTLPDSLEEMGKLCVIIYTLIRV